MARGGMPGGDAVKPRNGATRAVTRGPGGETQGTESNRAQHIVAGDRTRIDGAETKSVTITWTVADAERVLAFLAACEVP